MAAFDHWLPLHVGDYLADTMHLSTLQHGIYIRLIMHYWKRRGLPADERSLAQIAGIPTLKFRIHGGPVMALFTPVGVGSDSKLLAALNKKIESNGEGLESTKPQGVFSGDNNGIAAVTPALSHKRLDAELARAAGIFEKRKDAATRSAAGRKGSPNGKAHHEHLLTPESSESPTPAGEHARDSTTTTYQDSPREPPRGGRRGRDSTSRNGEREAKCGFIDTGLAMIAERQIGDRPERLQVIAGGRQ